MTEAWMIPNIPGLGGSPFFSTGGGGLSNAQTQYNQNQGYFGDQSRTMAAAQVPQSQLYGGGSFGAQPAHYAGVGAAYGRATGGFGGLGAPNADPLTPVSTGGGGGGGSPSGSVTRGPDLPDISPSMPAASPIPYLSGGGMPFGGGGFGRRPTVFDTGTSAVPSSPPMGSFSPSPNYPGRGRDAVAQAMMPPAPSFADTFSHFGGPPAHQAQNQPAIDAVNQMSLGGRFNPRVPPSSTPSEAELGGSTPGYTPDFQGPGDENSFANRFGFRNAGTPSEYTTAPYTDAGGTTRGPSQMPPGFSTPFGADNPGGALTRGMRQGAGAPPIMGGGDGEDTLTAQDAAIPFGPRGRFDPSAFSPSQYAPASPFGSGAGVGSSSRAGAGGLSTGTGTQMPPTQTPFFGGSGSGFGTPGSTAGGGQFGGRGRLPALVGAPADQYGNPFIQGSAPPFAQGAGRMGGGVGLGGLDVLGQGTVFRGR